VSPSPAAVPPPPSSVPPAPPPPATKPPPSPSTVSKLTNALSAFGLSPNIIGKQPKSLDSISKADLQI
jgi:hypothetical protein